MSEITILVNEDSRTQSLQIQDLLEERLLR